MSAVADKPRINITKGTVITDAEGRTATVTGVWRDPKLGTCVDADVQARNKRDTRRHRWAGQMGSFVRQWVGHRDADGNHV